MCCGYDDTGGDDGGDGKNGKGGNWDMSNFDGSMASTHGSSSSAKTTMNCNS